MKLYLLLVIQVPGQGSYEDMSERIRSKTSFAARAIAVGMLSLSAGRSVTADRGHDAGSRSSLSPPPTCGRTREIAEVYGLTTSPGRFQTVVS